MDGAQDIKTDDAARAKARERMAAYRKTPEYQAWLLRSRELRRGLKEKYRRQAGVKPRDAQAAAEKREKEAAARRLREEVRGLHDAHVKRFRCVMASRRKAAKRYANNPDGERARSAARKRALPDSYVVEQLAYGGFPREAVSPWVIELKREAIQFRRLSRQVREQISSQAKESTHEGIAEHP